MSDHVKELWDARTWFKVAKTFEAQATRIAELEAALAALRRDASQEIATDEMVRRLQHLGDWQAADRIDAQQKRIAKLEAALKRIEDTDPDEGTPWFHEVARAALEGGKDG